MRCVVTELAQILLRQNQFGSCECGCFGVGFTLKKIISHGRTGLSQVAAFRLHGGNGTLFSFDPGVSSLNTHKMAGSYYD